MGNVYLNLYGLVLEEQKAGAKRRAIEQCGKDGKNDLLWETIDFLQEPDDSPDFDSNEGTMCVSGELGDLGYISVTFSLDSAIVVKIIEHYQKRLNRLKTVLEAVK